MNINMSVQGGSASGGQNVTIYSTPSCHFCQMAKEFFKANNVTYTEYDVAGDAEKRKEMIEKSGQMGVPVIIIGDELIIGFDRPKISQLLGL
ncbi:MAG: glutaredoxin-like protein [Parcubacteria group bacterium Gr01-1014_24]|nr:MAG: glutaredoxin-like protein [Parcubacteria group bacterium Gr01-1014_24]